MLTYRLAKAGASVGIIGLAAVDSDPVVITISTFVLVLLWLGTTVAIIPRYRKKRGHEVRALDPISKFS